MLLDLTPARKWTKMGGGSSYVASDLVQYNQHIIHSYHTHTGGGGKLYV